MNLYGFVRNNGINWIDLLGLKAGQPEYEKDDSSGDLGKTSEGLEILGLSDFSFGRFSGTVSDAADSDECYSMSFKVIGAFFAILYDNGGNPNDPSNLDALNNTTRQHEEARKSRFKARWDTFQTSADPYERKYCTKSCAEIAKTIADTYHLIGSQGNEFDQNSFTLSSHFTNSDGKLQRPATGQPGSSLFDSAAGKARDADTQLNALDVKLSSELQKFSHGKCDEPCPKDKK